MKKMNPVIHFEMPAEDRARMSDFYSRTFGWETKQMGPEMGDYVVVQTGETDDKGMLQQPGMINGGFFQRTKPTQCPSVVIAVDDIMEHMKKVEAAGGKVLGGGFAPDKPDDIPGVGLYVSFLDTEGNRVGMLQPVMKK